MRQPRARPEMRDRIKEAMRDNLLGLEGQRMSPVMEDLVGLARESLGGAMVGEPLAQVLIRMLAPRVEGGLRRVGGGKANIVPPKEWGEWREAP